MSRIVQQVRGFFQIVDCYTFSEIDAHIAKAHDYLMIAREEFPVDVEESLAFLEKMRADFTEIARVGAEMGMSYRGASVDMERLVDWLEADSLRAYDQGLKELTTDMRSVLTVDVLEMYKESREFLDVLSAIVDAVR